MADYEENLMNISRLYDQKIILFMFSILIIPTEVFSNTTTVLSREAGGNGGAPFVETVAPGGVISKITIRSGKFIDAIQLTYQYKHRVSSKSYGGTGGKSKSLSLSRGEYITEFGGRSGKYIDSIYIKTSKGRTEKWGGNGGARAFKFVGTKNAPIQGVWGRSGTLIDAIGVVVRKTKVNRSQRCSVQTNVKAFNPDPKRIAINAIKGGDCGDKCDSYTSPIFPTLKDKTFWSYQNDRLYKIVQRLSASTNEFDDYINETEREHCQNNIYCEIDTRIDLVLNVLGGK